MGTIIEAYSNFAPEKCSKITCSNDMNGLPDDILVSILSHLTLKEAARTSVLSRRWRFLWTYFMGKIDFVSKDLQQIERVQFVTTMNEILKLHRGMNVESFTMVFDEINYSREDFDNWIEFAAKKGVQRLQLILGSYISMVNNRGCNTVPRFHKRFSLKPLQVLSLRFIEVNDEALGCFLTSSPNLQCLDLQHSTCLSNIVIPSSSLSLKELKVVNCNNLRKIEISARNLEIFDYFGPNILIEVKEVLHKLHTVYYGCCYGASLFEGTTQLGRSLPLFQLEKLTLDILLVDDYFLFDMDHFSLSKLKCLDLVIHPRTGTEMLNCIPLLNAAPILHIFTVKFFRFNGHRQDLEEFHNHRIRRHQCLKVLKIVNFLGIPEVFQFVKTVIDKVESLEKLIVVPNNCSNWHPTLHRIEKSGDCNIGQLLENGFLPSGIELIIESGCQPDQ